MDYTLLITVFLLLSLGLIMVLSASSPTALSEGSSSYAYFIRQLVFAILGLIAMFTISKIDYRFYKKVYKLGYIISIVLLTAVLLIGRTVNGAKRWIVIAGSLQFQPSEIVKLMMIILYAAILTRDRDELGKFGKGWIKHLLYLAPVIGLLIIEPHLSASIVIIAVVIIMMILAGCKLWQIIVPGIAVGVPLMTVLILKVSKFAHAIKRVTTFLDPWSDKLGEGWQVIQSLYAIGSGGLFGLGLGQSKQKYLYLPEPQNDFIFSVIAEELGFVGCTFVIILFAILIWRGVLTAMRAPDMFGSLLAIGITSLFGIQVIMNIAVVTSSMPATGMPLPFFSYGGTALFIILCEVGILLNISRAGNNT
ncbi:MAG: putative lipid II flippase FtsW [Clostridia bacterium]|nr:putative lipid II flippase FtsW [Clostridia bacterium]